MDKTRITLSQAIEGYFIAAHARRLSPATLADYDNAFHKLEAFLGRDPPLADISPADIRAFLSSLNGLSGKTLLNHHTGLSALWTWALKEHLVQQHIVRDVEPPRPEKREILPIHVSRFPHMRWVGAQGLGPMGIGPMGNRADENRGDIRLSEAVLVSATWVSWSGRGFGPGSQKDAPPGRLYHTRGIPTTRRGVYDTAGRPNDTAGRLYDTAAHPYGIVGCLYIDGGSSMMAESHYQE